MLFISIIIGKIILGLNRFTGSGGSALPGLIIEKIYPNFLVRVSKKSFSKGIILVTGTNGKTTATKMIANVLDQAGVSYLHNRAGSNLTRGIISAIIEKIKVNGRVPLGLGLFEVDEATLEDVITKLNPSIVVITNLFRDQLDRYGELDKTVKKFTVALENSKAKICLNSDDPLVAGLSVHIKDRSRIVFFGVDDTSQEAMSDENIIDATTSPVSSSKLIYSKRYYGHIGIYRSENKDFIRPVPQIRLTKMVSSAKSKSNFEISAFSQKAEITIPLIGLYNIYNSLAAISALKLLDFIDNDDIKMGLKNVSPAFGRMEKINYCNRDMHLLLIKNPTGFNQVIQTFILPNPQTKLLIIINDNYADGRDVSWLWDSAVEKLSSHRSKIIVSGARAYDMGLRLKYAGVKDFVIEPDTNKSLARLVNDTKIKEKVFVLPTYTAMLDIRSKLVKKASNKEFWQ